MNMISNSDNNAESRKENNGEHLFIKYKNNPDKENRNEIVDKYLYLAEIISKKFVNRGIDYEDIYQVACIALIKSVERFDIEKGVKFVSFATPTIIGEIKRYFRDKGSVIRIPRKIYEVYQKVSDARDYLTQELQKTPKVDEIALYLGISSESVLEIIESRNAYNIQSFDQHVYNDDETELHETVGEDDISFERLENRDFLAKSLDRFNEAEKEFIKMRYLKTKTQREIADRMGVSQMYISRMEKKVLDKFRRLLAK